MPRITWQLLTTAPNAPSAHVILCWLADYGVTGKVVSDSSLLGEFQVCRVFVDVAQAHRAKWALAQITFSDEELSVLATGSASPADSEC